MIDDETFVKMLDSLDWYYQYASDYITYLDGKTRMEGMIELANLDPERKRLFEEYQANMLCERD